MSERKVLSTYYPPDFDPARLEKRARHQGPKKLPTVRLGAPFSMKCTRCGEYIYKGRRFNAKKESTDEKYLNLAIYRSYIRCTRCSGEITFKTDPKSTDYTVEGGAQRNFEPWCDLKRAEESNEERLDRLGREEGDEKQEIDVMKRLEAKMVDEKTNMAVADALDEMRSHNDRRECEIAQTIPGPQLRKQAAEDVEDAALARSAFASKRKRNEGEWEVTQVVEEEQDTAAQLEKWQNAGSRKRKKDIRPCLVKRVKK